MARFGLVRAALSRVGRFGGIGVYVGALGIILCFVLGIEWSFPVVGGLSRREAESRREAVVGCRGRGCARACEWVRAVGVHVQQLGRCNKIVVMLWMLRVCCRWVAGWIIVIVSARRVALAGMRAVACRGSGVTASAGRACARSMR